MKLKNTLLIFTALIYFFRSTYLESGSLSESSSYPSFCLEASNNSEVFACFKRNTTYNMILEHVSYDLGLKYLNIIIQQYPELIPFFDSFRENDMIGNPITFNYGEYGFFSPSTLRYIKTAGDLIKKFGDLSKMNVVEIGGGYGGQCKILSCLGMFKNYIIIDLFQCNQLSRRYLRELDVQNVSFIDNKDLSSIPNCDLVISNYAFSEIDSREQEKYLINVIKNAKNGYMIYNFITPHSMPINQFCSYLKKRNVSIEIHEENPLSSSPDFPPNLELSWK